MDKILNKSALTMLFKSTVSMSPLKPVINRYALKIPKNTSYLHRNYKTKNKLAFVASHLFLASHFLIENSVAA